MTTYHGSCKICGNPLKGKAKHCCSRECAAQWRSQKYEKWNGETHSNRMDVQASRQLLERMLATKPFAAHNVEPGDNYVARLPGPDPERFGGLCGSSAGFTEAQGSDKP